MQDMKTQLEAVQVLEYTREEAERDETVGLVTITIEADGTVHYNCTGMTNAVLVNILIHTAKLASDAELSGEDEDDVENAG